MPLPFELLPPEDMEAISDDDMPEVDGLPVAPNVDAEEHDEAMGSSSAEAPASDREPPAPASAEKVEAEADTSLPDSTEANVPAAAPSASVGEAVTSASAAEPTETEEMEELEEILSDEDNLFDVYTDMELELNDLGDDVIGKPFNPYGLELHPLQHLADPSAWYGFPPSRFVQLISFSIQVSCN